MFTSQKSKISFKQPQADRDHIILGKKNGETRNVEIQIFYQLKFAQKIEIGKYSHQNKGQYNHNVKDFRFWVFTVYP
jgi:hypothetical protein